MQNNHSEAFDVCGLRDLSHLKTSNLLEHALSTFFQGSAFGSDETTNLCRNFFRLVDQTVSEYENCRRLWRHMIERRAQQSGDLGVLGLLFRLIGHVETVVVCLHRTILFADALDGKLFDVNRSVITECHVKDIKDFRHAILHWDERVTGKAAGRGELIVAIGDVNMMQLAPAYVELLGKRLDYLRLSESVEHMHRLARQLITAQPA